MKKNLNMKLRPIKQKSHSQFDKAKNLVLFSLKYYPNGQQREDTAKITPSMITKLKKIKDVKKFRHLLKDTARQLRVTSRDVKNNLANHEREWSHCYRPVARHLGLTKILSGLTYTKRPATTSAKIKKVKATKKLKKNNK